MTSGLSPVLHNNSILVIIFRPGSNGWYLSCFLDYHLWLSFNFVHFLKRLNTCENNSCRITWESLCQCPWFSFRHSPFRIFWWLQKIKNGDPKVTTGRSADELSLFLVAASSGSLRQHYPLSSGLWIKAFLHLLLGVCTRLKFGWFKAEIWLLRGQWV